MKAAIYVRISLDRDGERLAVTRQREACMKIIADRGWDFVGEYEDNSISASDARKQRPGYDKLCRDYDSGVFDALVCWDLDRLTRQPRQLEDWIDAADGRGLAIVTANGEADLTTDGGRMYARIKAAVAKGEVERKSARQKAAARQQAEMGRPPRGNRLTGYTYDGEIIEDEAALIREIFTRFAAGESLHGLRRWLNASGVPTRNGNPWEASTIPFMLTNRRYAGRSLYHGQDLGESQAPPIVDQALFDAVQARISDPRRKTTRHDTSRKHLGSGLYQCECGRKMRASSGGPVIQGNRTHRYACAAVCYYRSGWRIDELVTDIIRARLADPEVRAMLVKPVDQDHLARLSEERQTLRQRLVRVEADYDEGLIDGRRLKAATEKIEAQLSEIAKIEAQLAGEMSPILAAEDPVQEFTDASLALRQRLIRTLATITLLPGLRGRNGFRADSVRIEWRV